MVMTMDHREKTTDAKPSLGELEERAMKLARLSRDKLAIFSIVDKVQHRDVYEAAVSALRKRGMRHKRAKHFARAAKGLAGILLYYGKEEFYRIKIKIMMAG